jgi:hypothetical protein
MFITKAMASMEERDTAVCINVKSEEETDGFVVIKFFIPIHCTIRPGELCKVFAPFA